jgi:hypothetical protein
VGLTEEVERRCGGTEWSTRWRSGGRRLRWGGGIIRGGPTARVGGEGGDCERGVRPEKKNMAQGGSRPAAVQFPFKRGRWERGGGGRGSRLTCGAQRGRDWGPGRGGKWLGWVASAPGRWRWHAIVAGGGESTTRRSADTWARQHSAARFGFRPIQTESNLIQTDSNLPQILTDQIGAFPCSKNWK